VDHKVGKVLAAIIEAKAEKSMDSNKAWAQVAAQGAALCVLTFVSHVMTLTRAITHFLTLTQQTVVRYQHADGRCALVLLPDQQGARPGFAFSRT
jgi:hypothetical protein